MRHIGLALLASAAIAAVSSQMASAADLPVRAPLSRAPAMAPAYDWTGFYVGANLGWSFGRASTDWTVAGAAAGSTSHNMDGILGGLQAGYNWQSGNWLFGLETDIQATGQKGTSSISASTPGTPAIPCILFDPPAPACVPGTGIPAVPGVTGVAISEEKLPWFGTVRARLGWTPADRWLVYATGGFAYGEVESNATMSSGATSVTVSRNTVRGGWTAGAGIETALWDNWTAKFEYLHIDLGHVANSYAGVAPFAPITTNSHVTDDIVRVGVNYRFGGGPFVAR
jgi:outer membrane immunogenic protein